MIYFRGVVPLLGPVTALQADDADQHSRCEGTQKKVMGTKPVRLQAVLGPAQLSGRLLLGARRECLRVLHQAAQSQGLVGLCIGSRQPADSDAVQTRSSTSAMP